MEGQSCAPDLSLCPLRERAKMWAFWKEKSSCSRVKFPWDFVGSAPLWAKFQKMMCGMKEFDKAISQIQSWKKGALNLWDGLFYSFTQTNKTTILFLFLFSGRYLDEGKFLGRVLPALCDCGNEVCPLILVTFCWEMEHCTWPMSLNVKGISLLP